jgi:hypothetical protein
MTRLEVLLKMADVSISTIQELVAFGNGDYGRGTSSAYLDVELTADLDFNDLKEYDVAYNWPGCTGTWYVDFDGKGHTIDNIYYMGAAQWGFFGTVYGSVKNLYLPNMYVTSTGGPVSGLIADSRGATVRNCHVSGQLESTASGVSGMVINDYSTAVVRESSFSGVIRSTNAGWVSGLIVGSYANQCYNCLVIADIKGGYAFPWGNSKTTCMNCEFRGVLNGISGSGWAYNWESSVYKSIMVAESGSSNFSNSVVPVNSYFDSDVASAAGIVCTGTGAATAELHSAQWLWEHNFAV